MSEGKACILEKDLYGTKQAARCWWKHLSSTLASLGYTSSHYNTSLYTLSNKTNQSIIWVHVDNRIFTVLSDFALQLLEKQLKGSSEVKLNEGIKGMVGVKIKRLSEGFNLSQPNLVNKILKDHWDQTTT
jgi:hypothetical protein